MIRVYLGGPFRERDRLKLWRISIVAKKMHVTSRWLDNEFPTNDAPTEEQKIELCTYNLSDIFQSDIVVIYDPNLRKLDDYEDTPGRHIELGYAMGARLPIILVGKRTTVMHYDPLIRVIDVHSKVDELVEELERTYTEHWNR
jgi:nucleoside 2-deoxyribosyltransferase